MMALTIKKADRESDEESDEEREEVGGNYWTIYKVVMP